MIGPSRRVARFYLPLPHLMRLPDDWTRPIMRPFDIVERMRVAQITDIDGEYDRELVCSLRFMRINATRPDVDKSEVICMAMGRGLPGWQAPATPWPPDRHQLPHTVVEAFGLVPSDEDFTPLFDTVLSSIREIQRAYRLAFPREPCTLLTQPRTPPVITMFVHDIDAEPTAFHEQPAVFITSIPTQPTVDTPTLHFDELERLDEIYSTRIWDAPYVRVADLRADATEQLEQHGDSRATVLSCATACEVLLNDLLACLLWEETLRPETGAEVFNQPLNTRIRNQYHGRLGGVWSLTASGPIADWARDVAAVRHRIIHVAIDPSDAIARKALAATYGLIAFIAARLAARTKQYPRTAVMTSSYSRETRQQLGLHVRRVLSDPSEPNWVECLGRWRQQMWSWTTTGRSLTAQPDPARALLAGVRHPNGRFVWVLHDTDALRAIRATPPTELGRWAHAIHDFAARPHDQPQSIVVPWLHTAPIHNAEWLLPYRLLPLNAVMLAGDHLDPSAAGCPAPLPDLPINSDR